jgi:hypothetical protein
MRQPVSFLTQSKFYSPAFNAAIFDGAVRIYFAQYQEAAALKLYFDAQEKLKESYMACREAFKRHGVHVFIMLYPTTETYKMCFEVSGEHAVSVDRLDGDFVLGINTPITEEVNVDVLAHLSVIFEQLNSVPAPVRPPIEEAVL